MELKKELPQLTEEQEKIIDFWSVRGYENITHCLGMNISLHLKDRYVHNGLCLQYLEQFRDKVKAQILYDVMRMLEEHKFCSEYHKIQSLDDKDKYYKESCLFVIHKKIKEDFGKLTKPEVDSSQPLDVKQEGGNGVPPTLKSVGIPPKIL